MDEANEQMAVRRQKVAQLQAQGLPVYPNDFRPSHTAEDIRERHGDLDPDGLEALTEEFALAGRIRAHRPHGKAAFFELEDRSGRLQVYARKDKLGDEAYARVRAADVGDIVGVAGRLFRTRTNELTIEAREVRLLSKCIRPLPEKWHGLKDVETRYRQRYVDLMVNPEVREVFRHRSRIISLIRRFLEQRGFLEVETPMMQPMAGGAAAKPFVTHHNALDLDLYLRVAPELFLKRLLVGGLERVFELNRNFRNEGLSTRHNPEFTMVEFYQAYADYRDMMELTEELFVELAQAVRGSLRIPWGEHEVNLGRPWQRLSLVEGVARHAGVDESELGNAESLRKLAERHSLKVDPKLGRGKLLVELFEHLVEPGLIQPTFVTGYPLEVSPLARRNDANPAFVDRFELFIGGRELANAFSELNDPADQRRRFEEQAAARRAGDDTACEVDEDYVRALEYAMPPAAGEGIGIDRLVMLLTDSPSIRDVILFPLLRS
ncbi:MAG: lysine--tRNA ligase [Deltaproteobacteria bacterium]|nr:lysine--tRNA ligase [Deltaproteobacteria bacterium]